MELNKYIQEIKENRLKAIDLTHYQVRVVPKAILEFEWIEEIHFGNIIFATVLDSFPHELVTLPNLKNLSLSGSLSGKVKSSITDFKGLKEFPSLESLSISNSNFSDLSILLPLQNLEHLSIESTDISDFGLLSEFKNLSSLKVADNNLQSIEFLSHCNNLKELRLAENNISTIEPIAHLTNLKSLCLCACPNIKTESLKIFTKLEELCYNEDPWDFAIHDIETIRYFPLLKKVRLKSASTKDLSIPNSFLNLEELEIDEFSGEVLNLPFYPNLKVISISGDFKKVVAFFDYEQLIKLCIDSPNITSFQIANCPNLEHINLSSSKNLKGLEINNCPNLKSIDIGMTSISDLNFLDDWSTIENLSLSNSLIERVDELTSIKHLTKGYRNK